MSDVFISYSRKDIAFARLLHEALQESGLQAWIDWEDIPPTVEWLNEVYEAIEQADTFIFILSKTSVDSEICSLEISHAINNNKRLIPVVIDEVEPSKVTKELADLNWLFFHEHDEFSQAFQRLTSAIQTDYALVKEHTRLQLRALEWERKDRDKAYLLRGRDLGEAEEWLIQAQSKELQPTDLHIEFISTSRKAAKRRKIITIASISIATIALITTGFIIVITEGGARENKEAARQAELDKFSMGLLEAALVFDVQQAELCIYKGADVNWRDNNGDTPLHNAVISGSTEMAALLLEHGADVNARDYEVGWTPLFMIAVCTFTDDIPLDDLIELLVSHGADINIKDDMNGTTVLHQAVYTDEGKTAALLLEHGADVNARDDYNNTPLHNAAEEGYTEMAALLLEHGADVNARDYYDETPLHLAIKNGHIETAELLKQHGGVE